MNILVVGGGGREHAIIKKLLESKNVDKIFAAPGNAGIANDATCLNISAVDIAGMICACKENHIDFVVVAPDDPLVLGMVDALEAECFPCFGPNKAAAIIEGSKTFSKKLMKKYSIPTAQYEGFTDFDKAVSYVLSQNNYPTVIKADGLALGKGVIIAMDETEAVTALNSILCDKCFGESGAAVVIEEFLTGIELSVLAFTDGEVVVPLASSMDHKRVGENDTGLNTGGMGTIAPHPLFDDAMQSRCTREIFIPTIDAMKKEGRTFKGCLYFGLMLTDVGPKVIEYNCRFGDPETQVVLPLLDGDLLGIMMATRNGDLSNVKIAQKSGGAACVIMACDGYPGNYKKGLPITGLDVASSMSDVTVYHAGTKLIDGAPCTNGGRVLGVSAVGDDLKSALEKAYNAAALIHFDGAFCRKDIGAKVL